MYSLKIAASGALLGAVFGLVACGGSGSSNPAAGAPQAKLSCVDIAGPADPAQDALRDELAPQLAQIPEIGDAATELVNAVATLVDAVDALANGLEALLLEQDPDAFAEHAAGAGDAILCFADELNDALMTLTGGAAGSPLGDLPGVPAVLAQIENLQNVFGEALRGDAQGGDLTALTDQLVVVAAQLAALADQLPANAPDAPLVGDLLMLPSQMLADLAVALDAVGRLDAGATRQAISGLFGSAAALLNGGDLGLPVALPVDGALPVADGFAQAQATFDQGLGLLIEPLFRALSATLAPVTGPQAPFAALLAGTLDGNPPDDVTAALLAALEGGGTAPGGDPIPELSDLLAGVPVLGDLVATALGLAGGGTDLLGSILSGGDGLPSLADALAGIPGLGDAGSPPGVDTLADLIAQLLALDGDGVPVIGALLEGLLSGGNLPDIGGLLGGLLG
jgi:hypothetical protein